MNKFARKYKQFYLLEYTQPPFRTYLPMSTWILSKTPKTYLIHYNQKLFLLKFYFMQILLRAISKSREIRGKYIDCMLQDDLKLLMQCSL